MVVEGFRMGFWVQITIRFRSGKRLGNPLIIKKTNLHCVNYNLWGEDILAGAQDVLTPSHSSVKSDIRNQI